MRIVVKDKQAGKYVSYSSNASHSMKAFGITGRIKYVTNPLQAHDYGSFNNAWDELMDIGKTKFEVVEL